MKIFTDQKWDRFGVIFNKQGYIITNNHVVGFADKIKVTDSEGKIYDAKKIGTDKTTDLAVLKSNPMRISSLSESEILIMYRLVNGYWLSEIRLDILHQPLPPVL